MTEVAELAGVSISTVSHVINETRPVGDELRQRVLEAMDTLDYRPNRLARSLRMGETHTIGVIVPDSSNPFFAEVARGIEDASFAQGYSVILCNSDGDLEKELLYTNVLASKQVDGILFVAAGVSTEHIRGLQEEEVPVVVVDREIPDVSVDEVLTDNVRGGEMATRHLIDLGHRRIGCITGPSDLTPSADRFVGYCRALQEAGLSVDEEIVVRGDFQYEGGYQRAQQLLNVDDPPTAMFACNDLMAVGVIRAAREMERRVPADLSVVGFDDVSLASFTSPALTTVAQPKYEIGVLATKLLLDRMEDQDKPPRHRLLETILVVRRSTARVATGPVDRDAQQQGDESP
jgi:LacI family transcriptional regulator